MLISKKDLLAETGISYGQLYRWKRERLIPEEWFMKQASFTGQETFFPKEQILQRIRSIQELKDQYSLEELAKLLSPEVTKSGFTISDLEFMDEINNELISTYQSILEKDNFSYMEGLLMVILSNLRDDLSLSIAQVGDMLGGLKTYLEEMKSTGYTLAVFNKENEFYTVIYQEQKQIHFDNRFSRVKEIRIDDISNQMKIKYRKSFDLESSETNSNNSNDNDSDAGSKNTDSYEKDKQQKQKKSEEFVLKFNNWEVRL